VSGAVADPLTICGMPMTCALTCLTNIARVGLNVAALAEPAPARREQVMGRVRTAMLNGFLDLCITTVLAAAPAHAYLAA
jgi:nucleoside permease NupC